MRGTPGAEVKRSSKRDGETSRCREEQPPNHLERTASHAAPGAPRTGPANQLPSPAPGLILLGLDHNLLLLAGAEGLDPLAFDEAQQLLVALLDSLELEGQLAL